MTRRFVVFVLVVLALASSAVAENGVECALDVYQQDSVGNGVLLYTDTSWFVENLPSSGFLVAFSVELEFQEIDSTTCSFTVHAVTLGPLAANYSRQYRVEYGLPARLEGISGKNSADYTLVLTPVKRIDIDTAHCSFVHRAEGQFKFDPSGHLDIYYVPNSFGDFYWNVTKGLMEERYRVFKAMNNFNLPGKYSLYLCPCPMFSVIWDKRFGTMVDPTRNVAFTLYNRDVTADPFVILHASVYRHYGYAPAFLTEGLASYLSFAAFEMRQMVAQETNIPLADLLNTYAYFTADPALADRTSATFVKYLIDQYKIETFLTAYERADDLNLRQTLEDVYGKPLAELESEWLHYVDTVNISPDQLRYFTGLAESMFDYNMMFHYSGALLGQAATKADSIGALGNLVRAAFSRGDYYAATQYEEQLAGMTDSVSRYWMSLGSYQMMNGLYDDAAVSLTRAQTLDSTDSFVTFNRALLALYTGDKATARDLLAVVIYRGGGPQAEARVLLGYLLRESEREEDRALAAQYFSEAINYLAQTIRGGTASATAHLGTGIASLGLDDTGNAHDFLRSALLLETRPFYIGMANLWLGKVADVRGEHDVARDYYGAVISGASAEYHQQEARRLTDEPYRQ